MQAAKLLKEKVARGKITTGVLATDQLWPAMIEYLRRAEIDYLIIDQEHGTHDDTLVAEVCALGRMVDFPVLIRPIDCSYAIIRQTIDGGPCGLLLPSVESATQLDQIRESIYMPPRGRRRPGGPGNYWVANFSYATWKTEVEDDFIILPQIETQSGLDQVDVIAAHEITTAVAIGPYDLSADLGVCFDMDHPKMEQAIKLIRSAAEKTGKTMWTIGDGAKLVEAGFHFLCIAEPMMLLQSALMTQRRLTEEAAEKSRRT